MTRQEFTEKLPPFISSQLGITPPLMFRGVSARFFPMRANLDILQQLVDSYLNIVPPEAGRFRVPVSYVYLVILDYGQMGESAMRTGWFSQVEVYFGVALEWYKRINGQWVFHDWGVNTPYIFVNDDVSVPVGRTVFGFQKVLAAVELTSSRWMKDPVAPTTLAPGGISRHAGFSKSNRHHCQTCAFPSKHCRRPCRGRLLQTWRTHWAVLAATPSGWRRR
jgi:hypothetical protein